MNMTASGGSLQKTAGCSGCADASAVSQQQISTGTGSLEFVASESGSLRFVGLASGGIGTTAADIGFAVRLQSGTAEVREHGAYRSETSFAAGDRFRIAVQGGVVTYAKNGTVFYTSSNQASPGVRVHAVFMDNGATISEIAFNDGAGSTASNSPLPAPEPKPVATEPPTSGAGTRFAKPRPEGSVAPRRGGRW